MSIKHLEGRAMDFTFEMLDYLNPETEPVPDTMNPTMPWAYRFYPARRIAYGMIRARKDLKNAYVVEKVLYMPKRPEDSVEVSVYIQRYELEAEHLALTLGGPQLSYRPVLKEYGLSFDVYIHELDRYAPPLKRMRFTELTQSFPSDIILPQSRRYR